MKLLLVTALLSLTVFGQGKITSPDKILKEAGDIVELGSHAYSYSVHAFFENDYRGKKKKAKALKEFTKTCSKIGNKINGDFQSMIGLSRSHKYVTTSIQSLDHGKYGKQYLCYVQADVSVHTQGLRRVKLSHYSTPIFVGETGDETVLKECSALKFALRMNQQHTKRVSIHDRVETIRKKNGPADKKIYKCQVMWTALEIENITPPVCESGKSYIDKLSPVATKDISGMLFPYQQDIVPVRALGYYDELAGNKYGDGVAVAKIVEEKQIPFSFNTSLITRDFDNYELKSVRLKGSFIKSLKNLGNNPRFNNTELVCKSSSYNLCSGRHFKKDWAKYMDPTFWNNVGLMNTLFSDKVVEAFKEKAKGTKNQFVEVNLDLDVRELWGAHSIYDFISAVDKKENMNFIITDDMWVTPNATHLEFEFVCR